MFVGFQRKPTKISNKEFGKSSTTIVSTTAKVSAKNLILQRKGFISYETLAEYEEHCRKFADDTVDRHCDPYEFTTLYVEHDGGQMLVKKENVKSKEITVEYVLKLVEKDRKVYAGTYGKFAMCMQRLCKERGLTNKFCVYPTTYGIGVWLFWNFNADKHIAQVEEIMKERNIEYYNEYSNAHWVYRFKVSKKRENIERMCA